MIDYIAVHQNAAREYDQLAAQAPNPQLRALYRKLAAKRRQRACAACKALNAVKAQHTASPSSVIAAQDAPDYYWLFQYSPPNFQYSPTNRNEGNP